MIAYGIGILPPINNLKQEIPDITQTWYADNAGYLGTFVRIEICFDFLTCQGPGCGYYTKPSKTVLIARPENLKAGKEFGARHGFKMGKGARYIGGYIGDDESKSDWLRGCTLTWEKYISTISKNEVNTPNRVTPQWYVQSNQSEYLYNTSPRTRGKRERRK